MHKSHWLNYVGTPLVGALGALIASAIGWPLPWMIGSLVAVIVLRCMTPWQLQPFPGGRKFGQWIIGIGIGLHFTPALVAQIAGHLVPIVIGALITVLSSIIGVWFMRRTGETMATAYFSSMPGGSGEMVNLGARNGPNLLASLRRKAFAWLPWCCWCRRCSSFWWARARYTSMPPTRTGRGWR